MTSGVFQCTASPARVGGSAAPAISFQSESPNRNGSFFHTICRNQIVKKRTVVQTDSKTVNGTGDRTDWGRTRGLRYACVAPGVMELARVSWAGSRWTGAVATDVACHGRACLLRASEGYCIGRGSGVPACNALRLEGMMRGNTPKFSVFTPRKRTPVGKTIHFSIYWVIWSHSNSDVHRWRVAHRRALSPLICVRLFPC